MVTFNDGEILQPETKSIWIVFPLYYFLVLPIR
jgi:hypothetical protein